MLVEASKLVASVSHFPCPVLRASSSSFAPPHPLRRTLCVVATPSVGTECLHQLHTVCVSFWSLFPRGSVVCCFAGVNFFGTIEGFEPHYGFSTFGLSLNSLFRVCTRISWEDIMYKVRWHWVLVTSMLWANQCSGLGQHSLTFEFFSMLWDFVCAARC